MPVPWSLPLDVHVSWTVPNIMSGKYDWKMWACGNEGMKNTETKLINNELVTQTENL
jgi:hypothetical protein